MLDAPAHLHKSIPIGQLYVPGGGCDSHAYWSDRPAQDSDEYLTPITTLDAGSGIAEELEMAKLLALGDS
jgi:hypothetical protein